jgi:hypothetical protein
MLTFLRLNTKSNRLSDRSSSVVLGVEDVNGCVFGGVPV